MKPKILITLGDFNGIGPEVTLKALSDETLLKAASPVLIGSQQIVDYYTELLGLQRYGSDVEVIECVPDEKLPIDPGKISKKAGEMSARFLQCAIDRVKNNKGDAIVTAPISKEALWLAGYRRFPGQTEFFAAGFGVRRFAMVLIAGTFRVSFTTTHYPIRDVASQLTEEKIIETTRAVVHALQRFFGIPDPKIAVSALNPHGGEHGKLGDEEERIIRPAINKLIALGVQAEGPFPADTLFTRIDKKDFDAYLVHYHDQGMIPVKMVGFGRAVNFTAGLPVPRTSPDHGTAFDIAGKGKAHEQSMKEAIQLAVQLASHKG
ncbi:MAG: 4-hydroxythreonine-4-phosphate dehydrogenase PdxA [Calditrichaeota bacterium]|nr:4-hydroxythreonine-4-phosphate dehydrogenase PdxA [Calditrichota bacterium]